MENDNNNQVDFFGKIAFSLMVKHSEQPEMVKRCISSVAPFVDAVFLTITKNSETDDTKGIEEVAKEFNAKVSYFDWVDDFAQARNFAFSQISPKEYGWIYWQDVDDVLQKGDNLRKVLQDAMMSDWAAVFFSYWYQVDIDENGMIKNVVIEHKRERLVKNDGTFKWIGAIHETLIEQRKATKVFRDECVVVHLTNGERQNVNIGRNIRILEAALKREDRKDPRTVMYLAKAYFDRGKLNPEPEKGKIDMELAKNLFLEYLEGSGKPGTTGYRESSGWGEERSSAWAYMSDIYRIHGDYKTALKASFNAIAEDPKFPAYYLDIAMTYTILQQWDKAEHWLNVAKNIPLPNTTLIVNPRDLKTRYLEVEYHIAFARQDIPRATDAAAKLKEILPNLPGLEQRLQYISALNYSNKAAQSLVFLARYLEDMGEPHKIANLINAAPNSIEQEQFMSQMRHKYLPPRIWGRDEIAIICGPGFEKWSPKNVTQGIGGSEEAVIYQARELTKLGYKVTVYGDPRDDAATYENVAYRPWYEMNSRDGFNIVILWRAVQYADSNLSARQTYLWLHDVPANPEFTEERLKKIDKIFVLSEYHKSLLRVVKDGQMVPPPDDKVVVTANGITEVKINKKWERKPHSLIWTSSYDRGLPYLLNMWPDIKKEVSDATLDIYYGWNLYDSIHRDNPARMQWKEKVSALMQQEGITHHGRVGHKDLHKALAKHDIWSYPTDFQEISCISGMKAQAYGSIPVVTDFAALKETVQHGKKISVDITTPEGQEEYKQNLIAMLKDDKAREELRPVMMKDAQEKFAWSKVAAAWDAIFKEKSAPKRRFEEQ